jgi:hypothetical protein
MKTTVLLSHPGKEPAFTGDVVPWNVTASHARKYLSVRGHVARPAETGFARDARVTGLTLWGEFEPASRCHSFATPAARCAPTSWHEPLPIGTAPRGAQNTDPWIFGAAFRYAICRQPKNPFLSRLEPGSLVLFGSWMRHRKDEGGDGAFHFALDTALVVADAYALARLATIPDALLDVEYRRATLDRVPRDLLRKCALYSGASVGEERTSEPFSFAPGSVHDASGPPPATPRPFVSALFGPGYAKRGPDVKKLNIAPRDAWQRVVEHCLGAGYALAVRVEGPGVDPVAGEHDAAAHCSPGERARC